MADFPETIADYIAGLTDEDFINGGHRTNFIPTGQGTAVLAQYVETKSVEFYEYAESVRIQVAADAAAAAEGSGTEATVADIRSGASAEYISIRRILDAMAPAAIAFTAPLVWDMSSGINFRTAALTANTTLPNPSGQVVGKSGFIDFVQDSVGGRQVTGFGNNFKWFGPTPAWPGPNGITKVTYYVAAEGEIHVAFAGNAE